MKKASWMAFGLLAGCVTGGNGPPTGDNSLVRVNAEPAGANCTDGGVAIQTGLDTNDNHVLDDSEVTSTQYVCSAAGTVRCADGATAHTGTVNIASAGDAAALAGVSCIDGDLIVAGVSESFIPPLESLTTVTGAVIVASNALSSLDALGSLRDVGLTYLVQGNQSLGEIGALAALHNVPSIVIVGNDSLADLAGLSPWTSLNTDLTVTDNAGLTSLHGLENVTTTAHSLTIRSNHQLTSVDALSNMTSAAELEISGTALTDISLPAFERSAVRVIISQNPALVTVQLPHLTTLGESIQFLTVPALRSVAIPSLLTLGSIIVDGAGSLTSLDVPKLAYVSYDIQLMNVPELTSPSFPSLTKISGNLYIENANALTDFSGFSTLTSTGAACWLLNTGAVDFSGLSHLTRIGGTMIFGSNGGLTGFGGLPAMAQIGGNLQITQNPILSTMTASTFASQITVNGSVVIY